MLISEYYRILGIPLNSSLEDIKKAYRKKARLYHPDINRAPGAKEKFIEATEAYDFLMAHHEKSQLTDEDYFRIVEEWRKYRQERSHQRAQYYARSSYHQFKNSKYYKSTKLFNITSAIFAFAASITVFFFAILGYVMRLRDPIPGTEKTTIVSFIILLTLSLILLTASVLHLKTYIRANRKQKKKKKQ
ncbi:MAG: DnaJ domain-containing protein [Bacteroidales bacterium]|jgi:hypothetical protein|nr:DnaJ domain-containing protein [Bacteroidales bacterium]